MPIMRPEIQAVLRASGLGKKEQSEDDTIRDKLDRAGLSLDECAAELAILAKSSGNDTLRLRAIETGMKAHGALKDAPPQIPTFNLIIQPAAGSLIQQPTVNPIIFPRQSLNQPHADNLNTSNLKEN